MSRSRSSIASDSHDRLEPRLLRAVESDQFATLQAIVELARDNGQLNDTFLRIGLMRSCERGSIAATEYLLQIGAKTDVASNRPSPLLRAVERNHVRIVQLLLDHGASTETPDKKGRTVLMTAAWKNHWHVLQLLIARGADVNARDHKKRNVLHNLAADKQCDWGEDVIELLLSTTCTLDGLAGQDELGRIPLHWACATGKLRFAQLLLTRPHGPVADVNAVECRNKTALHIAVAHGRDDIVQLLLAYDADVNARSDGGWTPLHNACDRGSELIVRILLRAGANINSQLLNGVTPLHLAAQAGHREVVECLLEQKGLKQRIRDNFGSTPFLRAAQFKRRDIVSLLAPFNTVEALSAEAKGACEAFEATVVDFGNFHNENRVKKTSVFNLLYGRDPENPRKQAFSTLPADSRATDFRWIHLPANNLTWVEALLTKSFIEEGAHDVESFKGLEKSFRYQHRGQRIHSHFMRPLCQSTPRAPRFQEDDSSEEKTVELPPQILINGQSHEAPSTPKEGNMPRGRKLREHGSKTEPTDSISDNPAKKGKGATKRGKAGGAQYKHESKHNHGIDRNDKNRPVLSLCKDSARSNACNVCMFMPYLHFETTERRQKMQDAIQRAETRCLARPSLTRTPTRDELLISAHLASSTTSLHIRRTLDQFFYPNIDTLTRDQDQVVYRYQTKGQGRERFLSEPKIFMVDQLWMWILGTGLIVTSFPERWEQPKNDPLNVLDGIIEDINSKTREPVKSVYDLAIIITTRCSGVFDRHRMGDEEYQFLDMFEASIGVATDRETVLFNQFNRDSAQASDWLKNHRKLSRFARPPPPPSKDRDAATAGERRGNNPTDAARDEYCEADTEDEHEEDEQPLFVDNLLDIGQETDLLSEAKDIRDELNMIRTVLQHQQHVLLDFQEAICEIYTGQHRSQSEIKKRFKEQQRTIDMHLKDIDRMDKQAERIYSSITDLLDLKQKHANAFEARFARDQAAGTTRQGKIMMVFTIVTIVFLPLSFITSIFTINLAEFGGASGTGGGGGGSGGGSDSTGQLHLSYVAKYTFGIGFAISIPLIILALLLDDIGDACQEGIRRSRRWMALQSGSKRSRLRGGGGAAVAVPGKPMRDEQDGIRPTGYEFEKILSGNRSIRKSLDTDFAGSLLPISTRGTARRS